MLDLRRLRGSLAPLVLPLAVVLVAACAPSAPQLSDPKEILVRSLETLQQTKSVHLVADVSGQFPLDPLGIGSSRPLDFSGTRLEGDLDIAGKKARLSFSAPAFNLSGEVIQVGETSYLKVSLLGDKYVKSTTDEAGVPAEVSDPQQAIADLRAALDELATPPEKLGDEKCGDADCYRVALRVAASELAELGALGGSSGGPGDVRLEVWVRKSDLRPAKVALTAAAAGQGSLSVTLTLSDFDRPVTIVEPPPDQVQEGLF